MVKRSISKLPRFASLAFFTLAFVVCMAAKATDLPGASGQITFAENTIPDEPKRDSNWGIGVMVPLLNGQGALLERRLANFWGGTLWGWGHLTYQEQMSGSYTETETGRVDFTERHRFQLSLGADHLLAIPLSSLKRWNVVLGAGLGIRRSEVRSSKMDSVCRPRCSWFWVSSEVVDAATEAAAIGLLRAGVRVKEVFMFGERTELGVIFERNVETGVQLLSTNQAPSSELLSGERSKGSLLLEMSLKF
ncbi:MAG: hypothetical protein U1E10_06640 [Bdellovibrionales bacterium]|nr:hypothetical protein [Bdellovibrionales bacterium]